MARMRRALVRRVATARSGEDQNTVLEILSFPPIDETEERRPGRAARWSLDEGILQAFRYPFRGVGRSLLLLGTLLVGLVDLLFGDIRSNVCDFGRDVRRRAEEDPLVDPKKEIPSLPLKTGQFGLDFGHFQQRVDQRFDKFAIGKTAQRCLGSR
jgi:hypothetical protein